MVHSISRCFSRIIAVLCLYPYVQSQIAEIQVNLIAPRWVSQGGFVTLLCQHSVPNNLLYKVEFLKSGIKLLQYVRERTPPYVNYTTPGAKINLTMTTQNSLTLENLDFGATGHYWCEVSLETPIYTAASPPQLMTVVQPQKHPPIITFGDSDVIVGGMLTANCTSAPAEPAPHLTWYIDKQEVNETNIRRYSFKVQSSYRSAGRRPKYHRKLVHQEGRHSNHVRHQTTSRQTSTTISPLTTYNSSSAQDFNVTKIPIKCRLKDSDRDEHREPTRKPAIVQAPAQLTVSVSQLRVRATGRVQLTCVSTVPAYLEPGQNFADVKKQTVAVEISELSSRKSHSDLTKEKTTDASTAAILHISSFGFAILSTAAVTIF